MQDFIQHRDNHDERVIEKCITLNSSKTFLAFFGTGSGENLPVDEGPKAGCRLA